MTYSISNSSETINKFLNEVQKLELTTSSSNNTLLFDAAEIAKKITFLETLMESLEEHQIFLLSPCKEEDASLAQKIPDLLTKIEKLQDLSKRVYQACLKYHLNNLFQQCAEVERLHHPPPQYLIESLKKLMNNSCIGDKQKEVIQKYIDELLKLEPSVQEYDFGSLNPLSHELLLDILFFCAPEDILVLSQTSKSFYTFLKDQRFWENMLSMQTKFTKTRAEYQKRQHLINNLKNLEATLSQAIHPLEGKIIRYTFTNWVKSICFEDNVLWFSEDSGHLISLNVLDLSVHTISLYDNRTYFKILGKKETALFVLKDRAIHVLDCNNYFQEIMQPPLDLTDPHNPHLFISCDLFKICENRLIVVANEYLSIYDLSNLENISLLNTQKLPHTAVSALESDGDLFFCDLSNRAKKNTLEIWDVKDPKNITLLTTHPLDFRPCVMHKTGQFLFVGSSKGTIQIFDLSNLKKIKKTAFLTGNPGNFVTCIKEVNGFLFAGYEDGTIQLWDLNDKKARLVATLQGSNYVTCLEAIGNLLIAGFKQSTMRIWSLPIKRLDS